MPTEAEIFDARTAKPEEVEARLAELTKSKWAIGAATSASIAPRPRPAEDVPGTKTGTTSSPARAPAPASTADRFDARIASAAEVEARLGQLIGAGHQRAAFYNGGR